jgi:hypothetical protein
MPPMADEADEGEAPDIFAQSKAPSPVERASERIIGPAEEPKQRSAISSSPPAIAPHDPDDEAPSIPASPSTLIAPAELYAIDRRQGTLPLRTIVLAGACVLVVLVGLTLLLFR